MKICLLTLIILPAWCMAQSPDFTVYYVQGNVKQINVKRPLLLKKGDKLYERDMISLVQGAQLILICKGKNIIKLNKPDTLRLNTLENQCQPTKGWAMIAYFKQIWKEFNNTADENSYGAVSRGKDGSLQYSVDTINYLKGDLKISWDDQPDTLLLKVYSGTSHKQISREKIPANHFHLSAITSGLKLPGNYYWTLSNHHPQNGNAYYIKIWDTKDYNNQLKMILNQVLKTDPAETAYMTGFLMEKNHFLTEAVTYYKLACKLDPKNNYYKIAKARI